MSDDNPQVIQFSDEEIASKKILLENIFRRIYLENMQDVPVINEKLEVSVIGFQQWQEFYLGILITPWFINIILMPHQVGLWDDLRELSKQSYTFPSGRYSFITGRDKELGTYQMCSLFSPVFEFADNEAAIDCATVAIKELMNEDNVETADIDSEQIERIWKGEEQMPEDITDKFTDFPESLDENESDLEPVQPIQLEQEKATSIKDIKENLNKPISRREMLRGAFLRNTETKQ